jgi:hypothetical protein
MEVLREIWRSLTDTPVLKAVMLDDQRLGVAYHLGDYLEMRSGTSIGIEWRRCTSCQAISNITVEDLSDYALSGTVPSPQADFQSPLPSLVPRDESLP